MKKLVRIVLWTFVALAVLAALLVATLPLWLGPVARPVVNRVASSVLKVDFDVGRLSLNPYTGHFVVGDVRIANPPGYTESRAVTLGELNVSADLASVFTDRIHLREVTLRDCFVSYLYGGENEVDNLTQLRMNAAGGKEAYEAARAREDAADAAAPEGTPAADESVSDAPPRTFVIDRLEVSGVRVKFQMLTIPVPPITLTDLGKKSNGLTLAELTAQVWDAILKGATRAGDGAAALGGLINAAAGQLGGALQGAGQTTGDSLKSAAGSLKAAGQSANGDIRKLGADVKKTAEAVKGLLGL